MMDTQYICNSKPFCLCVGHVNDGDECCCSGNVVGVEGQDCIGRGAKMILIDTDTGEEIASSPSNLAHA